ncbi:helix-turn-helix domain-containing protein [Streptomyces tendae]|uniref:helix-turn-helix domain-containing protein n=1 Tax=Streptomyces tendae TaxID=1932 RepID=UPI0037B7C317
MTHNRSGRTFSADVTNVPLRAEGFPVFRRAWEQQTGEALPLPSFDTGESGAFRIRVRAAKAADTVIADVTSERFVGSPTGAAEGDDRVLLHLMRRGSWRFAPADGRHAHESVTVPAGRFIARRNGRPTHFDVSPAARATVLILPVAVLGRPAREGPIVGPGDSGEMRVLMAHADMMRETVGELSGAGLEAARDALVELASGALRRAFDDVEPRLALPLARAAMALADERLAYADLSPRSLAQWLKVSERTLHRAFAGTGETVAGYVRRRRLERARHELLTPWGRPAVSEVAARWHFADSSHFTRAFKRQFGENPSQTLAAQDGGRPRPPSA